jgi:dienelactone hydrolase family protein
MRRADPDDLDHLDRSHDVRICRVDLLAAQLADAEGIGHASKLAPTPDDSGIGQLAQTRAGARGALFFSAALPVSEFSDSWPEGVPLQIHMMESDEWALEDFPAARELVETVDDAELFLYPGDKHLFADSSLADYDEQAAGLVKQRVRAFLNDVD